jgi:diketogulonate reductase-like aldo/keto reductase
MSACLPACLPACLSVLRLIAALACGVAWACVHTGVSNYGEHHLDELLANASISPSINQVEISPFNQRYAILERNAPLTFPPAYCK